MEFKGSVFKVVALVGLTVFFLHATTYINESVFVGFQAKPMRLLADITSKKTTIATQKVVNGEVETVFEPVVSADSLTHLQDSLQLAVVSEDEKFITSSKKDSTFYLKAFFEALNQAQTKPVRIAYFGDSMIEGDLLTSDLRNLLQQKFGGNGVGFVPITSLTAAFRKSIMHTFSGNWISFSFTDKFKNGNPIPLSGFAFNAGYAPFSDTISRNIDTLKLPSVFYSVTRGPIEKAYVLNGRSSSKHNSLLIHNGSNTISTFLKSERWFNRTTVNVSGYKTIKASFALTDSIPLYGFSFESDKGVILDNFSFRGSNGINLLQVSSGILRDIQQQTPYDLIVLHYGNNVANETMANYSWYSSGLRKVLYRLKKEFPNASFLIVGASDKAYKNPDGVMATNPGVPFLVETQRKLANEFGCAFWNLYQDMGGYNSMLGWVDGQTVFANKDYTHLNGAGAKRMANMLYNRLMENYAKNTPSNESL